MNKFSLNKSFCVRFLILIFTSFAAHSASAYSSGRLNCYFEMFSKNNWPKMEKTPTFDINIMEAYEQSIESKWLGNKIRLLYVPGIVATKDVQVAVVTMTYAGADAGADVSLKPDGTYVFKIGRQDSDLVGAFLNCRALDLKP
ncbi:MAG: hypothetical protein IPM97_00730 [Bdellovibrionaceae bacterium]|nr:hypothetical protein [Pseudobdellovibrionaceae bacterium]